jgi:hypothetical protein
MDLECFGADHAEDSRRDSPSLHPYDLGLFSAIRLAPGQKQDRSATNELHDYERQ